MKFLITLALVCALAFATVDSAIATAILPSCNGTETADSQRVCDILNTSCVVGRKNCDKKVFLSWLMKKICKDNVRKDYDKAVAAQITDCECSEPCSGATFAVMSLMAIFVAVLV